MSLEQELEQTIQMTHLKLKKITLNMEQLEQEFQDVLKELDLTPEAAKATLADSSNYSLPIWEELQRHTKQLDEKLQLDLKNIKNPLKNKKTFAERSLVQPHWLFVR